MGGASAIYGFAGVTAEIDAYQAPIYEAPQPFARIVNNTIMAMTDLLPKISRMLRRLNRTTSSTRPLIANRRQPSQSLHRYGDHR